MGISATVSCNGCKNICPVVPTPFEIIAGLAAQMSQKDGDNLIVGMMEGEMVNVWCYKDKRNHIIITGWNIS